MGIIDGDVARATVQDYEAGELILLPRKAGAVTYELNAGMTPTTTVLVDDVPVFDLSGIWEESDLNIQFNDGKNVRRVTTKPSRQPTSDLPTVQTSDLPTVQTSDLPTFLSSNLPTVQTSDLPSFQSSYLPTVQTSYLPTFQTSDLPTVQTSELPTFQYSDLPTVQTSELPTVQTNDYYQTDDVLANDYYQTDDYYLFGDKAPVSSPSKADVKRLFPSQVES